MQSNIFSLTYGILYICLHTRFDRKLLGKLCACAWTCTKSATQRLLGHHDVVPRDIFLEHSDKY